MFHLVNYLEIEKGEIPSRVDVDGKIIFFFFGFEYLIKVNN